MAETKVITSKLIVMCAVEPKDELDEKLERSHAVVLSITKDLSEREANDALQAYVSKGCVQHDEVQMGLFYSILIDPKTASRNYRDITLMSQDGMSRLLAVTNQLIYEKWIKLTDACRTQLVWFIKELVRNSVPNADHVCHSLLRQIAGGDLSPRNVWLAETVLDIFTENRPWLDKCPNLLALSLYTYLRIIIDHGGPLFANLRQREVDFCVLLMRERWSDCQGIGRDLIRLLQSVARIQEFEELWKDILQNPTSLSPQFTGIRQLLSIKTSRRFFSSRLTPDMENKLNFLTSRVRFGQQKRYQDWFQRQYLSTPESQSLRCDLIRYICAVIHPSNEVLCSDIIPRWAVIGWLLTTCTSNVAASNAKLALFYDWFFFDVEKDSIMNIEPCILVMYHSMRPHPAITATLLDFMCRITPNFYPPLTSVVRQGILASLNAILEKRVLPSLAPLFDNPKLDKDLCTMLRENFAEFCSNAGLQANHSGFTELDRNSGPMNNNKDSADDSLNHTNDSTGSAVDTSEFSDDEELPLGKVKSTNSVVKVEPKVEAIVHREIKKYQPINLNEYLHRLEGDIKAYVTQLPEEKDKESQCEIMDRLMQVIIREDFEQEDAVNLAKCLCHILKIHFESSVLPQDIDDESIEDSIGAPVFVIFRNVCQTSEEDPSRVPQMMLLEEMYKIQSRVGYHLLYFLKVSKLHHEENMSSYRDFCKSMENQSLESCLMSDLRLCQEEDARLFAFLVPDIYTQFANIATGNVELLHLVVSCIDGSQLQDLICEILQGQLIMFRDDSILSVLNASLEWETIEQYFVWQLIAVHSIAIERIMPILPKLDFSTHAEALSNVMIQLKQDGPTMDLLRPLLCRECKKNDLFTVSMLKFWAQEYNDKLAELLHVQLMKSSGTPKKRNRTGPQIQVMKTLEKDQPSVEQILAHLDHMRVVCKDISFIMHESIQQALQHIQTSCSDSLKAKYSDLLALVDEDEMRSSTRVLRQVPSRRASQAATKTAGNSSSGMVNNTGRMGKKSHHDDLDSSTDSSDDDDGIQIPKSKRIKRSHVTFDD